MADDEDFDQPSQWRDGHWVQRGSSQRRPRGQNSQIRQSQPSSRLSQGQSSQRSPTMPQSQPVTSTINNNAAQDLLMTLIQSAVAAKLPAKEKKPKMPERERIQCLLCESTLANQNTLFKHYKNQHKIPNPARFLGYKESSVFNLDTTMEEFQCTVCGFMVPNSHALDIHLKVAHNNNDSNKNGKQKCNECGFEANNKHQLDVHSTVHASSSSAVNNTSINNGSNNSKLKCNECGFEVNNRDELDVHSRVHASSSSAVNNTNIANVNASGANVDQNANKTKEVLDRMHKCDKCVCYFEEKRKLDEHMKDVHGKEIVCNICNKYLPYEEYEEHFKNTHPDVFNTKNKVQRKEKTVVKKFYRNMSGKIVVVYKCVKCNNAFEDETNAKRHVKLHKRVRTADTADTNTELQDVNENDDIQTVTDNLYTCGACHVSTASYDVAVEHSQAHLTNPNVQFATKICEICNLTFESIWHEHHVTRHCVDENLRRESFTCFEYDHNLLLTSDWAKFLPEEGRQRIISKSIYQHTRCVRMRVLNSSETQNSSSLLFQCGKCKRFVAPSSVANHTRNYDTCMKIHEEFPCSTCKRSFNDGSTLNDHKKLHDHGKGFKIVVFNTDDDKTFNELLKNAHSITARESSAPQETSNVNNNILYKCLCCLCFISKETADEHVKVCPGKEPRQYCQKCNYLFSHSEIMPHHLKHHATNEVITFVIENITPESVEIESDNEPENDVDIEVIDLSDDDMEQTNNAAKIPPRLEAAMDISSNNEVNRQRNGNLKHETNVVSDTYSNTAQFSRATVVKNEDQLMNDETGHEVADSDNGDAMSVGSNDDTIDDTDTQGTVDVEHDETREDILNTECRGLKRELKCVPTSALINPLYFENRAIEQQHINEIDTAQQVVFDGVDITNVSTVKTEPNVESQFIRISGRPTLRSVASSSGIPTYDLLTDDEDPPNDEEFGNDANETVLEVNPRNENVIPLNHVDKNVLPDQVVSTNSQQQNTVPVNDLNTDFDLLDDITARSFFETDFISIDNNSVQTFGTVNAIQAKENILLNMRDNRIISSSPIVANNRIRNRELEELNKLKQRLISLSENETANEIKELSLSAVFEKTDVTDQNVRINIEYNTVANERMDEISSTNVHAAIKKRNSYRSYENALHFNESLKLTSNNNDLDIKQAEIPKRANFKETDKNVVNKPNDFLTAEQNGQNIENISSSVVRRGKISMRMKRELKQHETCRLA